MLLTTIYLVMVTGIGTYNWEVMIALTPYEWGDYLAGVFGPLALIWLVLGFFQQGDELRFSAEALWLQSEELRNSVEQQKALVEATREQVAFEKQNLQSERIEFYKRSQPILFAQYAGFSSETNRTWRHNVNIENTGQDCSDVKLSVNGELITRLPILRRGESIDGWASIVANANFEGVRIDIAYTDINGNEGRQSFRFEGGEFQGIE